MDVSRYITTPCVVTPVTEDPDEIDEYGNPTKTAGTPFDTLCFLDSQTRSEATGLDELQTERWVAYFLPTITLGSDHRVEIRGDSYEVFGPPGPADNPISDSTDFITATLIRTT